MKPLLEVNNLCKTFPVRGGLFQGRREEVRVLDGVSISLQEGESVGLVGESGSGKTTLARVIAGFLSPTAGDVRWEGQPQSSFPRRQWAGRVQMVFQDPSASLNPKLSVGTLIQEALSVAEVSARTVESVLSDVGMPSDGSGLYPHQFSGGQKQRIAIARALAVGSRLLIADEPVSALDLSIQAQILNLLADLKEKWGLSLILISHDLTVVRQMTDRVVILDRGRVVETGPTKTVLGSPQSSVTQALLDAVPKLLR
ncbi:MAG: ABC transporter ATP-binding protein [Elusimicrobia bacterium]|nr:ABC transporter ATP-binding protein [Elusimicrobiota bacterium]